MIAGISAVLPWSATARQEIAAPPDCTERSWTAGTAEWCHGTLVYRDYVYDDTGADTGDSSPHAGGATGDVDHRDTGEHLNAADLLALRIRRAGHGLYVRFELNTLFPEDQTLAALAIDTDGDPETGGGRWGSKLPVDVGVSSAGWDVVHLFHRRDATANVIDGVIPLPPGGAGATWRFQAVTALRDGTVMNVAFRPDERPRGDTDCARVAPCGGMWEEQQATALAAGTIDDFGVAVAARDVLEAARHEPAGAPGPGLHERVYRSDYAIAEGVDYDGVPGRGQANTFGQAYTYLGHHQPYAVYVPKSPREDGRYGVQLALHGVGETHSAHISFPGMQTMLGDGLDRLVVSTLSRGPDGWYSDWSERDVLDVMDDVERTFPVDPARVFAGGYSMGGYGALRFAALHPDRFAGAISWVGYTGDTFNGTPLAGRSHAGAVGNALAVVENTRHVPMAMLYTAADELVHVETAVALQQRYAELGYEHVMWMHAGDHLTLMLLDDWRKEAAWTSDLVRVHRPARVTYRANTLTWRPDLGIVHDGAYWVDGMTPRDAAADMAVDLVSHACDPASEYTVELRRGAGVDPVPWVSQEGVVNGRPAIASGAALTGSVANVAEVTIDVEEACLGAGPVDVTGIRVDGPTVVHFSDGRPPQTLS